jgi:hypothetical protein
MPRLHRESSRSYPGRSARLGDDMMLFEKLPVRQLVKQAWAYWQAVDRYERNRQQENSGDHSASCGNMGCDRAEVSRGHSSHAISTMKGRTQSMERSIHEFSGH